MALSPKDIIKYREIKKLSRQGLADLLGVNVRSISNWENGETISKPAETLLQRLIDELNSTDKVEEPVRPYIVYVPKDEILKAGEIVIKLI